METVKFFNRFFAFSIVLMVVGFGSCSKDDEPAGEEPAKEGGGRRLVSKMEWVSDDGEENSTARFFYNKDGSLQKVTNDGDELGEITFTRAGNELIVKEDYTAGGEGIDTYTGTLNADGYVIACNEGTESYTYEYQNGFLKDGRYASYNWNATWQNGNLTKVVDDRVTSITYTNRENKMNVEMLDFTYPDLFFSEFCMTSGYLGKRNKQLVENSKIVRSSGNGESSREFSYEFDPEGYVTKIFYTIKEYNGKELVAETFTITFSYVE